MSYYVYVLISESTGRRYIGQTGDLSRRLREHNDPVHNVRKYTTRQLGPWRLVWSESFPTRQQAMARERWLKSGAGRGWLDQVIGKATPQGKP